jgi:hypothetical protein
LARFDPTRWNLVIAVQQANAPQARQALTDLCARPMRRGEIIEIDWQFSNLTGSKLRPAV